VPYKTETQQTNSVTLSSTLPMDSLETLNSLTGVSRACAEGNGLDRRENPVLAPSNTTLRPPKRHGEDGAAAAQRSSPKRARPSPSPDPTSPTRSLTPDQHLTTYLRTQYGPVPMEWVPTPAVTVGAVHNVDSGSHSRICYGAVRRCRELSAGRNLLTIPAVRGESPF
jgi:hypothetical protein